MLKLAGIATGGIVGAVLIGLTVRFGIVPVEAGTVAFGFWLLGMAGLIVAHTPTAYDELK